MPDSRERTPDEREAARLERERRRARADSAQRAEPGPPANRLQRVDPQRADLQRAEPERAEPQRADPERVEPERAEPQRAEPERADPQRAEPLEQTEDGLATGFVHGTDGEDPIEWEDDHEVASGTRRVGWREREASTAAVPGSARPRLTPRRTARGPRSVIGRTAAVLVLLLGAGLIWFCIELFQPFHGSGHGSVTVTVPAHSGARQVGNLLERDGVIASGFFFDLRAALEGDRGKLLAGTYHMKLDMSYGQALKALTTPPPAAKVTNVTVIPGKTRAELAALLQSQGIRGSYLAATRHSPLLNPLAYGAPRSTHSLEGFLYPDTYQLREPISIAALVADQLHQFRKQFGSVNLRYARSKHLTPYQVLIVASMVEAEAETAHDRPLIASVIYNRLADGMPLQIDATTRYATGNYTRPLTQSELNSPSPYNTRIRKGLTPTPIDSPGLSSIEAAAHPARTNYLYFVVKPCGNGEHAFASNYSQFLAEVHKYYSARSARGGRSPANC